MAKSISTKGMLNLIVVYLIWGCTFLFIRLAVHEGSGFPPFAMAGSRVGTVGRGLHDTGKCTASTASAEAALFHRGDTGSSRPDHAPDGPGIRRTGDPVPGAPVLGHGPHAAAEADQGRQGPGRCPNS